MCSETEAKLRVSNLTEVENIAEQLGGKFAGEFRQIDSYFDDKSASLLLQDKGLRIRMESDNSNGKAEAYLTWKGTKNPGEYKNREEIELGISDYKGMAKLLQRLGYDIRLTVKKTRRVWEVDGCSLCLDKVDEIGEFVEIEGDGSETIADLQKKLGLGELKHIKETYAEIAAKQHLRKS
jgi:adenylate cyclase class 2